MREHFIREIDNLQTILLEMSVSAGDAIVKALDAVLEKDAESAKNVIEKDCNIDLMEVKIEEECLKIIALYQPVAKDLRTIVAVLKINAELERIADFASTIARRALDISGIEEKIDEEIDFTEMLKYVYANFQKAMGSFIERDCIEALNVIRADDLVDKMHRENFVKITDLIIKYPNLASYYLDCLSISKSLERICDISTNISENLIYLEQGKIIRHSHL